MGENENFPPLVEKILIAGLVIAVIREIFNWIEKYQEIIAKVIQWIVIIGITIYVIYLLAKLVSRISSWVSETARRIKKLESDLLETQQSLNQCREWSFDSDRMIRRLEGTVGRLRKFTGYDDEMEKQRKLKEAMVEVGAKQEDKSPGVNNEANCTGSEAAQSY